MNKLNKFIADNRFFLISLFFFTLITFPKMINHIPWYDEAHAYIQAGYMNFDNWIPILSAEGHPILWFLLLKPLTLVKKWYPYPMLILNYIFCIIAIILIWFKSPFNNPIKFVITFSSMFVVYFSIVSRGYTLGIIFLFLLCSLYDKKTEHPFLYPTIVGLTINLNIICGIPASWFGLMFFTEVIKSDLSRKIKISSTGLLVLSVLLFLLPFLNQVGSYTTHQMQMQGFSPLFNFFFTPNYLLFCIFLISLASALIMTTNNIKKSFLLYVYTIMLFLFGKIYPGDMHHYIFFFMNLILFLWINTETEWWNKKLNLVFTGIPLIILLLFPLYNKLNYMFLENNENNIKQLINNFNNDEMFRGSRLYIIHKKQYIVPYLNDDIEVYDICDLKPFNWDISYKSKCYEHPENMIHSKKQNVFLLSPLAHANIPFYKWGKLYLYTYQK